MGATNCFAHVHAHVLMCPAKPGGSCSAYKSYLCRGDKTKSEGSRTDTKIDPTETG